MVDRSPSRPTRPGTVGRAGLPREQVPSHFDDGAADYDRLVGMNPGYHDHLRASAARMRLPRDGAGLRLLDAGCGTGASTAALLGVAPRAEIVGIEFEPEVVRLARRHLDLDETGVRVEIADARAFVEAESKKPTRYDAILEDVFVGAGDDVHKPDWIPDPMHPQAFSMLAPGGVFVSNTLDEHARVARSMRARFEGLVAIETEDYDNRVLAAGGPGLTGAALRERVAASEVLAPSLDVLSFRTRA